jgi:predicted alpha-1,2-mannosidase
MNKYSSLIFLFFPFFFLSCSHNPNVEDLCKYVNPFIGTGTYGHTYPGPSVPFGMIQPGPETNTRYFKQSYKWCAGYHYDDSTIMGFSHTHFTGCGHSDLGDFLIMPMVGKLFTSPGPDSFPVGHRVGYRSHFSHSDEEASPGYYRVMLQEDHINAELTATCRAGLHRYTFPASDSTRFLLDMIHTIYEFPGKVTYAYIRIPNDSTVLGYRETRGYLRPRFIYFAMVFSKPFNSFGTIFEDTLAYGSRKYPRIRMNFREIGGQYIKAFFNFKTKEKEQILLRIGISSVSSAGAMKNLQTEIPDFNFERVRSAAYDAWNKELAKITIKGNQKQKEIFYTSMYHAALAPTVYMDVDGQYRGIDKEVHTAVGFTNYTTFSLWDIFRTEAQLFTLIRPNMENDFVNTLLAFYDQSPNHILPTWTSYACETFIMIGYHSLPFISDAYLKGFRGYDTQKAYQAMKASATADWYQGCGYYMKLGFVPSDKEIESASKTLEYAMDDWSFAQVAKDMGKTDDYKEFMKRSAYYKNIFDPKTRFIRAKTSDGNWREPFDPFFAKYGGDYTEANAWQYTWYVPQDVHGLIDLMGGPEAFAAKLDSTFILQGTEDAQRNVEDISGCIGQYAHGNEPSQHIPYLYVYAGMPWKTQEKIAMIVDSLYGNTPGGICGNEDCGQLSAWYIFTVMGFYPVNPAEGVYVFGTPLIPEARIDCGNGNAFLITTVNYSDKNIYIQSVKLNGQPYTKSYIRHADIIKGGTLEYTMGPLPDKKFGSDPADQPQSKVTGNQ